MGLPEQLVESSTPHLAKGWEGGFKIHEELNPPQSPFFKGENQAAFAIEQMA
jgi:hypothetical protein